MNGKIFWTGMALAIGIGAAASAQRVDDRYDFQPGDLIQFGAGAYPPEGSIHVVVSCEPVAKPYRDCLLIQRSPTQGSSPRPFMMDTYRDRLTLVGKEGAPGVAAAPREAAVPQARQAPAALPVAPQQTAAGGACPKTPYGGPVPGTRPASAALFRQKIADATTMAAYGPYWYGVEFDAFTVGAPIRNSVGLRAGIGASRVTNGAPANATLYPVSATVRVCEGAPSGSSSWRSRESKYFCFVSANNEWTCGATT